VRNQQHYQHFQRKDGGTTANNQPAVSGMSNNAHMQEMFERQMEQHQQLMLQQQEQALRHFNNAVRNDIEHDKKVLGEEDEAEELEGLDNDELSSADSLDEGQGYAAATAQLQATKRKLESNNNNTYDKSKNSQRLENSLSVNQIVTKTPEGIKKISEPRSANTETTAQKQVKLQLASKTAERLNAAQETSGNGFKMPDESSKVLSVDVPLVKPNQTTSALRSASDAATSATANTGVDVKPQQQQVTFAAANAPVAELPPTMLTTTSQKAIGFSFLSNQRPTNSPSNVAIVQPQLHSPANTNTSSVAIHTSHPLQRHLRRCRVTSPLKT
jgi:hypothetical protein